MAPFCEEQGGAIIGSTINKYAYCSILPREDDKIIVHSLDFDMTVQFNAKENIIYDGKLDLVKAAMKAMSERPNTMVPTVSQTPLLRGTKMERMSRAICRPLLMAALRRSVGVYHEVSTARRPPSLCRAINTNWISTMPQAGIQALNQPGRRVVKKFNVSIREGS